MKRVAVVTATRAEFGLLRPLMQLLADHPEVDFRLIVTGAHLSPEFGSTWRDIERAGFRIDERVEMLISGDTQLSVARSMSLALSGVADALARQAPDVVVLLGDRYEALAAACAASVLTIPVAHIHGGEASEGAIDELHRHAITKLSHLHFTAAEAYRERVIQMGEAPERVWAVGGVGLDTICEHVASERGVVLADLDLPDDARFWLVTWHPETLTGTDPGAGVDLLVESMLGASDHHIVVTGANADAGGRAINERWRAWLGEPSGDRLRFSESLGHRRYLDAMAHCDGVVGNSSSGIIEAPSRPIGSLDIGDRQRGRLRASSVLWAPLERAAIEAHLAELVSPACLDMLAAGVDNPYGDGRAAQRIADILVSASLDGLTVKPFHDLGAPADAGES